MPAGRNQVDWTDIRWDAVTMKHDGTIVHDRTLTAKGYTAQYGLAVTILGIAEDTVSLVGDNEPIFGGVVSTDGKGFATIQRWGVAKFPMANGAAAVTLRGRKAIGGLGAASAEGYVKGVDIAVLAQVAHGRGEIVNIADTAAIVVDLG